MESGVAPLLREEEREKLELEQEGRKGEQQQLVEEVKQEKEVEVEEVRQEKQVYLTEVGMPGDSPEEIVTWMEQWQPEIKHLTNGLVVEIEEYPYLVVNCFLTRLLELLGIHESHHGRVVTNRFMSLFRKTKKKVEEGGMALSDPWVYLELLLPGGKGYDPALLQPRYFYSCYYSYSRFY